MLVECDLSLRMAGGAHLMKKNHAVKECNHHMPKRQKGFLQMMKNKCYLISENIEFYLSL